MKLRLIALAGVAVAALSSPASAGTGWYLGFGAGMSNLEPVRYSHAAPALSVSGQHDSGGAFQAALGYKFDGAIRLESEFGYSSHDIKAATGATGDTQIKTTLIGLAADIPVFDTWNFSIGAGIGAGAVRESIKIGTFTFASGEKTGFAWKVSAGVSVPLSDSVDFFADYAYRNVELNQGYTTSYTLYNPIVVKGTHEQNIMFGLRWYPGVQ